MPATLSGYSRQHRLIRKNTFIWCGLYLILFTVVILRLAWLQLVKHPFYADAARNYHRREVVLPATRGSLLDRNAVVLALDDRRQSLFADPTLVQYSRFTAEQLAPVIGPTPDEVVQALTRRVPFVWVKRDLPPGAVSDLQEMKLPGLLLQEDGKRYRIGVELSKLEHSDGMSTRLADALGITQEAVDSQLGDLTTPPSDDEGNPPRRTGRRWLRGTFGPTAHTAVTGLHFAGLLVEPVGPNYSLGADPRQFNAESARITAAAVASLIEMTPEAVERRLRFRPRFTWIKRGLSEDMTKAVQRLQGTVFVVQPGAVLDQKHAGQDDDDTPTEQLESAVERLYAMLNPKEQPEQISKAEIRRRLLPGAMPGALGTTLVKGRPSKRTGQRLAAKPIPGVMYGLPGLGFQRERRRYYPMHTMAAPTLGFVSYAQNRPQGAFGLESAEDATLRGTDGLERKEVDARGGTIPEHSTRQEPVDGRNVTLTIDQNIQQMAERELAKAVQEARALRGECIVMDPLNGEILAMATYPAWDANAPGASKVALVNPAVSNYYEPGSTFKTITALAALEEGVARPGQTILTCGSPLRVGNHNIGEAHNYHGRVDLARFLEQSCNICGATLALKMGPERFVGWCEKLGFGKPVGIGLANESHGSLNKRNMHARITLANMGFGQSLAVTPLQMAAAYSVVANGGEWVQPHLVQSRDLPDGSKQQVTVERRRVCSEETARILRDYLEKVVSKGTGGQAAIPGYLVAGKTGTAQKPGPGGFRSGKYIGSFIGFLPAQQPRFTIVAIIDEPKGSIYGGVIAAPILREVGRQALQYMNIPPTEPVAGSTANR